MTQPNDAELVKRLLEWAAYPSVGPVCEQLVRDAAARVEALEARERVLREALERIDKQCPPPHFDPSAYSGHERARQIAGDIARAALGDA